MRDTTNHYLQNELFAYNHGAGVGPTIAILEQYGVFQFLKAHPRAAFFEIAQDLNARGVHVNPGNLHIALDVIASIGWLAKEGPVGEDQLTFIVTPAGQVGFNLAHYFLRIQNFMPTAIDMHNYLFGNRKAAGQAGLDAMVSAMRRQWDISMPDHSSELYVHVRQQVINYLNGMVAAPVAVSLKDMDFVGALKILADLYAWRSKPIYRWIKRFERGGVLDAFDPFTNEIDLTRVKAANLDNLRAAMEVLQVDGHVEMVDQNPNRWRLTLKGLAGPAQRAWSYGVTVSICRP